MRYCMRPIVLAASGQDITRSSDGPRQRAQPGSVRPAWRTRAGGGCSRCTARCTAALRSRQCVPRMGRCAVPRRSHCELTVSVDLAHPGWLQGRGDPGPHIWQIWPSIPDNLLAGRQAHSRQERVDSSHANRVSHAPWQITLNKLACENGTLPCHRRGPWRGSELVAAGVEREALVRIACGADRRQAVITGGPGPGAAAQGAATWSGWRWRIRRWGTSGRDRGHHGRCPGQAAAHLGHGHPIPGPAGRDQLPDQGTGPGPHVR